MHALQKCKSTDNICRLQALHTIERAMFKLSPQKPHLEVQDYIKHQDVYMWCLAWDIALKGHIPFASCYFAEIVLLNWAFLPDLKDASKSTCFVQLWCTKELLFILASHKEEITPRAEVISGSHLWCTARLPPSSNREKWQTMYQAWLLWTSWRNAGFPTSEDFPPSSDITYAAWTWYIGCKGRHHWNMFTSTF